MSRNLRIFVGGSAIFYFIAVINGAQAVYVLSGICLAVVAGCYWLSRLAVAGLQLTLTLSRSEVLAGGKVPIKLLLKNIGLISRPAPLIDLSLKNLTLPDTESNLLLHLPALRTGEKAEGLADIFIPARGRWQVGPAQITGTDPLGMFRRPGPVSENHMVLALPEIFEIPGLWQRDLLSPAARQLAQARTRQGGEYWGIRAHTPGEDLRHVHWKIVARTGELMVKDYAQGRELATALWLDLQADNVAGTGPDSSLELAVSTAASILPVLVNMDQAVALAGDGLPAVLANPDRGEAASARMLRALAEIQARSVRPFAEVINEQVQRARPGLTAVVITSGVEPGLTTALRGAAARGVVVRCLCLAPGEALSDEQQAAQQQLWRSLRQAGIPVAMAHSRAELPHLFAQLGSPGGGRRTG
jgi:uncharacterized protein (DUF58 family)